MPEIGPHTYTTRVEWKGESRLLLTSPGLPPIEGAPPVEFHGPGDRWSPETLLAGAMNGCLFLTFLAIARKARLDLVSYRADAEAVLETVEGKAFFTRFTLRPRIAVRSEADVEKARTLAGKAEKHCFVAQSLRGTVTVEPEVFVEAG